MPDSNSKNTTLSNNSKLLSLFGNDLFGNEIKQAFSGVLANRYIAPPFTVLDSRAGSWQERKRAWISLGIQSEIGRDAKSYNTQEWIKEKNISGNNGYQSGTSIFDPVLTEIIYKWFCPIGGQIIDPFAGGSVRGIVASFCDFNYWGCDISEKQIIANNEQSKALLENNKNKPTWIIGDSTEKLANAPCADFLFSCPPYGDLEKYSNDPKDLSNMEWWTFESAYKLIIFKAVQKLKDNSFACFVVGDFRDEKGFYRNFVSKTIEAFENAGCKLYNEAILLNATGSAAIRAEGQFANNRKLVKTHQNVLIFCRGDWKKAAQSINAKDTK